jgi:hypothetical protein
LAKTAKGREALRLAAARDIAGAHRAARQQHKAEIRRRAVSKGSKATSETSHILDALRPDPRRLDDHPTMRAKLEREPVKKAGRLGRDRR